MMSRGTGDGLKWKTSVTELLTIFRNTLLVLIPWVERAQIAWRDEDAYDDWDAIAEVLFQNIVVRSIRYAFQPNQDIVMPRYDLLYDDYSVFNCAIVLHRSEPVDSYLVFHSFSTQRMPLDTVRFRLVDTHGQVLKSEFEFISSESSEYAIAYPLGADRPTMVRDLSVDL